MTPKEKAKELFDRYCWAIRIDETDSGYFSNVIYAKDCALIAVDEVLNLDLHDVGDYRNDQSSSDDFSTVTWYINYWEEVKNEIEKL
jgi:hypothetical protein